MQEEKNDFDIYVEKYSEKHGLTSEEAKTHKIVRDVKSYYEEKGVIT